MHLTHLSLANFRKYVRLELDLPPHMNVIYGTNAQGKTNLLESIYFLATMRSPRAGTDRELINWLSLEDPMPFARVACDLQRTERVLHLEVTMTLRGIDNGSENADSSSGPSVAKRIRINNMVRRASDLIGQMNVVLFSPQDVDLVAGAPAGRRRYMDLAICQVDPRYLQSLQQYVKVVAQRNHLLRLIRDKRASADQLLFWDEQLIAAGTYILIQRYRCIDELAATAADRLRKLTGEREHLEVLYASSAAGQRGGAAVQRWRAYHENGRGENPLLRAARTNDRECVQRCFREELNSALSREIAQGVSLVGPHRDDLQFLLDGHDATLFGSRGQQRAIALAMKLAESAYMRDQTGELPVLLLDDAFSELDESRRLRALTCIDPDQQVLITTTSVADYQNDLCAKATVFEVEDAQVRQHCQS
ncbi:MAG: DNA replication/repair protein RecF [Chloroflexota bacterium]|nr:MAG: DNA replication/repair protein RecF [Chloroflexota bacterium]